MEIRKGSASGASGAGAGDRHRDVNDRKERITALANPQSRIPIPGSWAARPAAALRWAGTGSRRGRCAARAPHRRGRPALRSEEPTSELQSLMRISYAVFCLKKKKQHKIHKHYKTLHI